MDQLLKMIFNRLTRGFVKTGINTGIDFAAGKGKPREEMTKEERAQAKEMRVMAKRAKEMQRVTRRIL